MAMLEAGEMAEMTESEEVASNQGFNRGLSAGAARERNRNQPSSGGGPSVSAPNLKDDQALTWSLLLILAIVVVWVSPWGKYISDIVAEITTYHPTKLDFNPLSDIRNPLDGIFHGANQPAGGGGGGGGGGGTSLFNVPIVDSSGGAGTIQVVAHDAASASENAHQGGNTPTGSPTAV